MSKKSFSALLMAGILVSATMAFPDTCSICGDSLTIVYNSQIAFPHTLPGDTIRIRKLFHKSSGQISLLSNFSLIKTFADLDTFESKEHNADNRYMHMSTLLEFDSLLKAGDSGIIRIEISLMPISNYNSTPVMDKPTFLANHAISEVTLQNPTSDADYKNSPDIIITDLRKNDIILLNFDIDVASLDPYFQGEPVKIIPNKISPSMRTNITSREYFSINGRKIDPAKVNLNTRRTGVVIVSEISGNRRILTKRIYQ